MAMGASAVSPLSAISSRPEREALISRLTEEHRAIKERLRELERHIALTSAERVEYAELKKMKLATKDRIRALED
jgi:hypothetical protein